MTQIRFKPRYELYCGTDSFWRWQFRDADRRITAQSSTAYETRSDCMESIAHIQWSRNARIYQMPPVKPPKRRLKRPTRVIDFPAA